jgi:electron transfer flavoprotein beta subunit
MDIVVLAKYVPSPSGSPPEIGPNFRLRREETDGGLDPSDEPCIETAVRVVAEHGGRVTVVSVGPERAVRALQRALAFGADNAILVVDPELEGADALATAKVLAAAIERRPFDLVVAGVESTDGATGTMPMTLAELLGVPSATFARRLVLGGDRISIERQTDAGYDTLECGLPALVTLTAGAAEARHLSLKDTIEAKKKPLERLSLADLGLSADDMRPTQHVTAVEIAPEKEAGELLEDETEAPARIVQLLEEAHVI